MRRPAFRVGLGRDFDSLWLGESVSAVGTQLTALALPTFAILQLRASAFEVGVLTACTFAGYPLAGILAAPLIDRSPRRRTLLVTNAIRAAALLTVPLAGALGFVSFPQIALVALVVSACTALFDTAYQAVIPALVARSDWLAANARLETSQSVANLVGPAIAGWLIQLIGALMTLVGDALSYLWSALMILRITVPAPPASSARPHPLRDIASSFAVWYRYRPLVVVGACVFLSNIGGMAVRTTLLLVAYRVFDIGPAGLGLVLAVGGVANIVGAGAAGRVSASIGIGPALLLATAVEGLAWAIVPLGSLVSPLAVLIVASAIAGLMTPVWNVNAITLRQRIVAPDEYGRVVAVARALAVAGIALGAFGGGAAAALLEGVLGERAGLLATLTAAAIVAGASGLVLVAGRIASTREFTSTDARASA